MKFFVLGNKRQAKRHAGNQRHFKSPEKKQD